MMKPEEYLIETKEISGWKVNVTSYSFAGQYCCHIDNVDPGAVIVRTEAPTREEALLVAITKAKERLSSKMK
ncbi:MAG TPA: hypothetical protein VGR15_07790 [Bacteroidota bacterium]|jgi:hypothetical protein|nr:hypothetical protein [Bacteroidota bacterium]